MKYLHPDNELELLNLENCDRIIGIDEVGRGCWAGPVAVGAYVFTKENEVYNGVHDSKKITAKRREELHSKLSNQEYLVKYAEVDYIDEVGIAKAIEFLIEELILLLNATNTLFLIDGQFSKSFGSNTKKIIRGDSTYYSIAAASILAKVERDSFMVESNEKYPGYGFHIHKGYGTKMHRNAIKELGICEFHRKSYKPIAKYL